jgi:hypothetical protein
MPKSQMMSPDVDRNGHQASSPVAAKAPQVAACLLMVALASRGTAASWPNLRQR